MSLDANLNIHLGEYQIMDIVGVYLKRGLSVFDSNGRAYIITSDDYDWEYLSVTFDELSDIITERERSGLTVGIMLYENGEPVTDLLKTTHNKLSVACDLNRRTLDMNVRRRYTDVSWYIEKFVAPLESDRAVIEWFEFWESR